MSGDYTQWSSAKKVCVIGAGTMGSGIAAHLANVGFEVTLLDLNQESVTNAFARAKTARPPHFYSADSASGIRLGSITDNLDWAAEADWVCEAIVEKLDAKQELFEKLDRIVRPDAMISTNTSGLQIGLLASDRSESFRHRFLGTHFFNPPRYLKLLELIPTEETDPLAVQAMTNFLESRVARRVIQAKDTPGFIANRFGMWAMFHAIHVAEKLHLTAEQVDLITGPFLGRPRSGSFRLNDIVGLDIMQDIASNLIQRCPEDPYLATLHTPRTMSWLLERGWVGDKAGQGFYRREGRELVTLDFNTLAYREKADVDLPSLQSVAKKPLGERISAALDFRDEVGEYLREYLAPCLQYANYLKDEISHNVQDFDRVMMWGFGWEMGPFEMIDAIGANKLSITDGPFYADLGVWAKGTYVQPAYEPQYRRVQDFDIVKSMESLNLRELGDGVQVAALTTKMGVVTPTVVRELTELMHSGSSDRLVLASEAKSFSAGFDLSFFVTRIEEQDWAGIDQALLELQTLSLLFSQAKTVAAVHGHCLGAGLELAMGCQVIVASAESAIGLPEAKVGLIPGGSGTVRMRHRRQTSGAKGLAETLYQLLQGPVSANAEDARRLGYLRPSDIVSYHPDRLIHDAKVAAHHVITIPQEPWIIPEGPLTGMIGQRLEEAKNKEEITDHDEFIGDRIKYVFTKSNSFEDALAREREAFIHLCEKSLTLARIKHMLETGKPLRN